MPDWNKLRDDFPIATKYAYLATAAIAPIPMPVYNEVSKFYQEILNHGQTLWDEWESKMEQTRDLYAKFIGADDRDEIAFTHSTSEGMNIIADFREKERFSALDKDLFFRKPIENEDLIKKINAIISS